MAESSSFRIQCDHTFGVRASALGCAGVGGGEEKGVPLNF